MERRAFLLGGVVTLSAVLAAAVAEAEALEAEAAQNPNLRAELEAARARIAALEAELATCHAKPLPRGLSTSGFSHPFYAPELHVAAFNAYWDDIEPEQGAYDLSLIDQALDAAEAAGVAQVRLRPYLGYRAPAWAKALGDGPIPYTHPSVGEPGTVADVLSLEYQAAVDALEVALADRYDDDPRVALVFATGGMLWFGEPFIWGIVGGGEAQAANRAAFLAAGYTRELAAECLRWQLDAMSPWVRTPIGLAYNPWQYIDAGGAARTSLPDTAAVMDHHAELYAERAVLTNHSIRASYATEPPPLYELFRDRPEVAHQFQTAGRENIALPGQEARAALITTLHWAIDYLATSCVEVYPGAWNDLTAAEVAEFDTAMGA